MQFSSSSLELIKRVTTIRQISFVILNVSISWRSKSFLFGIWGERRRTWWKAERDEVQHYLCYGECLIERSAKHVWSLFAHTRFYDNALIDMNKNMSPLLKKIYFSGPKLAAKVSHLSALLLLWVGAYVLSIYHFQGILYYQICQAWAVENLKLSHNRILTFYRLAQYPWVVFLFLLKYCV